jgi:hypothetical protein
MNMKLKVIATLSWLLMLGASLSAFAGLPLIGSISWEEEVLPRDGSKIIVKRWAERGENHEIGEQPPFKEQSLSFTLPGTNEHVTWKTEYSKEVGFAELRPLLLDVSSGSAYLVTTPVGCLSYNKWDRPNPPYVVFRYQGGEWKQIPLQELPVEMKTANVITFISHNNDLEGLMRRNNISGSYVTAEMIKKINNGIGETFYMYNHIFREDILYDLAEWCQSNMKAVISNGEIRYQEIIIDRNRKAAIPNREIRQIIIDRNPDRPQTGRRIGSDDGQQ